MFPKRKIIVFIAVITFIIFLCVPVFGQTDDEEKPPEKKPVPTVTSGVLTMGI